MTSAAVGDAPRVSVAIITFNQERFIAQAVESALAQQTTFDYEVVVGEDCSTDGTRAALLELQRRHPGRLRLLLHSSNLGMNRNFAATLGACRGRYVAWLEGDDYWTASDKLQVQADHLAAHPEQSLCFHKVRYVQEDGRVEKVFPEKARAVSTVDDLLRGNFIQTCSVMARRELVPQLPEWFFSLDLGDWPYFILNAERGPIGFLDRVMADYRLHPQGTWSSQDAKRRFEKSIRTAELLRNQLAERHRKRLNRTIAGWRQQWALHLMRCGGIEEGRAYAVEHFGPEGWRRIFHFQRALESKEAGARSRAHWHLLRCLLTRRGRTEIAFRDLRSAFLAMNFPNLRQSLSGWRRQSLGLA